MKKLLPVILLYWILLAENKSEWLGVFIDLGNGQEIRLSLILQVLFLLHNIFLLFSIKQNLKEIKGLLSFMLFLILSTFYVAFLYPQYFKWALSINLHIQLVFNIIIYISWSKPKLEEIIKFMNWLRFFGLVNALLIIISFFFPTLISTFEATSNNPIIHRAFGLMGDEASSFITFFFFDALIFKHKLKTGIFAAALFFTGSIGAFITFITLFGYYQFYLHRFTTIKVIRFSFILLVFIVGILMYSDEFQKITVVKRVFTNIENPEIETGQQRLQSLKTAYDMTKGRPVLGSGYGAYANTVKEKFHSLSLGNSSTGAPVNVVSSAFNPYMQIFSEAGLLGFIFFVYLLKYFLRLSKMRLNTNMDFIVKFRIVTYGWLLIFFITCISANWLLPSSFLFLLVVTLVGLNLRLNSIYNAQPLS